VNGKTRLALINSEMHHFHQLAALQLQDLECSARSKILVMQKFEVCALIQSMAPSVSVSPKALPQVSLDDLCLPAVPRSTIHIRVRPSVSIGSDPHYYHDEFLRPLVVWDPYRMASVCSQLHCFQPLSHPPTQMRCGACDCTNSMALQANQELGIDIHLLGCSCGQILCSACLVIDVPETTWDFEIQQRLRDHI